MAGHTEIDKMFGVSLQRKEKQSLRCYGGRQLLNAGHAVKNSSLDAVQMNFVMVVGSSGRPSRRQWAPLPGSHIIISLVVRLSMSRFGPRPP